LSLLAHALLAFALFRGPSHRYGAQLTTFTVGTSGGARGSADDAHASSPPPAIAKTKRHARRPPRVVPPAAAVDADSARDDEAADEAASGDGTGAGIEDVGDGRLDGGGDRIGRPATLVPGSCTDTLDYPDGAMRSRHEGVVRMILSLDERGHVLQAKVTHRAGFGLDETALAAVQTRCRFLPARDEAGQPVSTLVDHWFLFHIAPEQAAARSP
jgi:TonB family protein